MSAKDTKYAFVYVGAYTEALIKPLEGRIDAALARRGYEATTDDDASVLIHVHAVRESLRTSTREMTALEAGTLAHRDSAGFESPRHRNLAGMIGGGRYAHLLNDRPDDRGEIFIGPSNEIVATGDLRHMRESPPLPSKVVVTKITGLILRAVPAPAVGTHEADTILWQVEVVSEQDIEKPTPDMSRLVEVALAYLEQSTHGRTNRIKSGGK